MKILTMTVGLVEEPGKEINEEKQIESLKEALYETITGSFDFLCVSFGVSVNEVDEARKKDFEREFNAK